PRRDDDLADGAVDQVGNVEIAGPVAGDAVRDVERRCGAGPVGGAGHPGGAGDRGDGPGGDHDLPDGIVEDVGDVEVAGPVAGDCRGVGEAGGGAGPVGGAVLAGGAGQRGDRPRGDDHLADGLVGIVGNVEVANPVAGHAGRAVEA